MVIMIIGIALLILDLGARKGWVVSTTSRMILIITVIKFNSIPRLLIC
jgi:hypothetical protein